MTRISENQSSRTLLDGTMKNRRQVEKFSEELTSGYKVTQPGDSSDGGTISRYRQTIDRLDGYSAVIAET